MKLKRLGTTLALVSLCAFRSSFVFAQEPSPLPNVAFPRGNLFAPLIADPKQPRLLGALAAVQFPDRGFTAATAAVGDDVGIFRWSRGKGGGVQVGLAGGIFAQFDLNTPSMDLINADYLIGVPVTFRRGRFSGKAQLYHQSSHLGDEYVLREPGARINLSFESLALLLATDLGSRWRFYGGGEYLLGRDPATLAKLIERVGAEYRGEGLSLTLGPLGRAHPVAAVDLRSWEQNNWSPGVSFNAGLEFVPDKASPEWSGRTWSVLLFLYRGPSPYGQFYSETISYAGTALQLGF